MQPMEVMQQIAAVRLLLQSVRSLLLGLRSGQPFVMHTWPTSSRMFSCKFGLRTDGECEILKTCISLDIRFSKNVCKPTDLNFVHGMSTYVRSVNNPQEDWAVPRHYRSNGGTFALCGSRPTRTVWRSLMKILPMSFCWASKSALCLKRVLFKHIARDVFPTLNDNLISIQILFDLNFDKFQPIPMKHHRTGPIDSPRFCPHRGWQEGCGSFEVIRSSCLI